MFFYGVNRKVSYRLQIYVNTKEYVVGSIQPCLNCASAVKNYGATKLMEVCQACGVCEPGAFDRPDTNGESSKFQDSEQCDSRVQMDWFSDFTTNWNNYKVNFIFTVPCIVTLY